MSSRNRVSNGATYNKNTVAQKKSLQYIFTHAVLQLGVAAGVMGCTEQTNIQVTENNFPVVYAHVGAPVTEAVRTAGLKLNYATHYDDSPVVIDYPVRVHYSDPHHSFDIPPTRMVFFNQSAGIITSVETTPVLDYVDLRKAHGVALDLMISLQRAGWTQTADYSTDFASVEKVFLGTKPTRKIERPYGEWKIGTVTADVYVKKVNDVSAELEHRPPEDLYLPTIDVFDSVLRDKLTEKVFARRIQEKGNFNESLPLSTWVEKKY